MQMCASLNHRKKKKAESSHPIPRKLTPNQWRSKGGSGGPGPRAAPYGGGTFLIQIKFWK